MKRAICYIDGYNWYHAIFKHFPEWKWLNVESFLQTLRPHEQLTAVKLFSAMIDPDNLASDARERQDRYFAAIRTLPKVKIILGQFQLREVESRATCRQRYAFPEEKKTDVNIAVELISDAVEGQCDSMVIVSGDSDIQPAVEWVARHHPDIAITVYVPALTNEQPRRRLDYFRTKGIDVQCNFLPLGNIKDHQLPNVVKLAGGKLAVRPHTWTKVSS